MCVCVRVCLQREKDPKYLILCTIFSVRSKYTRILEKIRTLSPESVHELITICDLIILKIFGIETCIGVILISLSVPENTYL